jgi:hypothetical protein
VNGVDNEERERLRGLSSGQTDEDPTSEPGLEPDTEGHSLSMNPTLAGDLARARAADVDREARGRIFRREARNAKRQGR